MTGASNFSVRRGGSLRPILVGMAASIYLIVGAEMLYRFLDGYEMAPIRLEPRTISQPPLEPDAVPDRATVAQVTFDPTVSIDWFFQPTRLLDKPVRPELQARSAANAEHSSEVNYLWNENYLRSPSPAFKDFLRHVSVDDLFTFHPYDSSSLPRYRLYPDTSAGLGTTDTFGWFAPDVTVAKPPDTIRIGIVGDSTAHSTYGFYLQTYLAAWAKAQGIKLKFEVLNAARQGIGFDEARQIFRYELGPMGLDYVYEHMAPGLVYVLPKLVQVPDGVSFGKPPVALQWLRRLSTRYLTSLQASSALIRHLLVDLTDEPKSGILVEPPKPAVKVRLPQDIDENAPSVDDARRVPYLSDYLDELDDYKHIAESLNVRALVSTERLCIYDGMVLTNPPNRLLYESANGPLFWPVRYRDVRRILDFHNRVIAAWARQNGIALVDIDGIMPRRPEWCTNVFHDVDLAQHLRAWIIFQNLLPLLRQDIASGRLPQRSANEAKSHPYLSQPILRVSRRALLDRYDAEKSGSATP